MVQIPDILHLARVSVPDRTAVAEIGEGGRSLTFAEVDERAGRLAAAFLAAGARPGDRIGLLALNEIEYLEVQIATQRAGLVLVPLNFRLAVPELAWIVADCEPSVLITGPGMHEIGADLGVAPHLRLGSDDSYEAAIDAADASIGAGPLEAAAPATILYTSGTTGRPKGAVISNHALHSRIAVNLVEYRVARDDRFLQCLPLFHIASTVSWTYATAGATNLLVRTFDAAAVLEAIERNAVTAALLVPAMIASVVDHPDVETTDLSSLRLLAYGASPIPPTLLARAVDTFGCGFLQLFGMTETSGCSILRPEDHDPVGRPELLASAGTVSLGFEVRVVDEHDHDVAEGDVGEIVTRGPCVMDGYWRAPEATAEALRGGWMHTGDLGRRDGDGYLYVTDRKKDMIVSGGENVYPREVEDVLYAHPDVLEAAVIGVPDERWGERVHAVVVPRDEALEGHALQVFAREHLAGYKVPKSVEFVEALPRNATGKVQKQILRAPYWEGHDRNVG